MKILLAFLVLCSSLQASGMGCSLCEDGTIAAPHGGLVEHVDNTGLIVEFLPNQDSVEIYLFGHDLKPIAGNQAKVQATLELPSRLGGSKEISLNSHQGGFKGPIRVPNRARYYKVHIQVEYDGESDGASFTVEP